MMNLAQKPAAAPIARAATPIARAIRIAFVDEAPVGRSARRFAHPRRAAALEEDVPMEAGASAPSPAEPTDGLLVVCVSEGSSTKRADANAAIVLEHGPDVLEWRPGHATVQCRDDSRNDMIAALTDFAFYEGNLRELEASVEAAEAQAHADVALAHRVRFRKRGHWERFIDCAEQCSRMRLTFARLEPQLLAASRTLTPAARSWMTRLLQKADMESRLESLNDRLEALEELYEGATQRIAEYRWYAGGHSLEIGIIALLLIECMMMGADIYLHNRDRQDPQARAVAADVRD